jgi:hypothetical protein
MNTGMARVVYRDFDLPPPDTKRLVTQRKAVIVYAVRAGYASPGYKSIATIRRPG